MFGAERQHTVADILRAWRESKSDHTLASYQRDLETFAAFASGAIGGESLPVDVALKRLFEQSAPMAHQTVLYFRSHLQREGLAPASINRCLSALRSVAKLSRMMGACLWVLETPNVRRERRRDTRGPSVQDVKRMLAATGGDTHGQARDHAIITTLFCCGLRCAELVGLTWQDTDLSRGTTWILGKGRRERELVQLPGAVVTSLRRYARFRGPDAGPLFLSRGRAPRAAPSGLDVRSVGRIVQDAGAQVGVRCWPHALRHASITAAAEAGAREGLSLDKVRAHSRHSNLTTLQRYLDIHDLAATQRQVAELVGRLLE